MQNPGKTHNQQDHREDQGSVFENENRINWERRNSKKKDRPDLDIDNDFEAADIDLIAEPKESKKQKKQHRKKRRQLVMDEDSGRVVVKRRRKQHRSYDEWEDDE